MKAIHCIPFIFLAKSCLCSVCYHIDYLMVLGASECQHQRCKYHSSHVSSTPMICSVKPDSKLYPMPLIQPLPAVFFYLSSTTTSKSKSFLYSATEFLRDPRNLPRLNITNRLVQDGVISQKKEKPVLEYFVTERIARGVEEVLCRHSISSLVVVAS